MAKSDLKAIIQECLPEGCTLQIYHLMASLNRPRLNGFSHLLVAVQDDKIIFAIELIEYHRPDETLIYVSKVDSTGCHRAAKSPISGLTLAFLLYIVQKQLHPWKICLFARAQDQYIFPYSAQNKQKHILADLKLIKWWINLLERVRVRVSISIDSEDITGHLLVPGEDQIVTRRCLLQRQHWRVGHPYDPIALASDALPKFPDDPKGRFLDDLKEQKQDQQITVSQFWELMAYRQEMSYGHSIGFIALQRVSVRSAADGEQTHQSDKILSQRVYDCIYKILKDGNYANEENTKKSTRLWLQELSVSRKVKIEAIHVVGVCPGFRSNGEPAIDNNEGSSRLAAPKRQTSSDSVVHTLVPRKKKVKSAQS